MLITHGGGRLCRGDDVGEQDAGEYAIYLECLALASQKLSNLRSSGRPKRRSHVAPRHRDEGCLWNVVGHVLPVLKEDEWTFSDLEHQGRALHQWQERAHVHTVQEVPHQSCGRTGRRRRPIHTGRSFDELSIMEPCRIRRSGKPVAAPCRCQHVVDRVNGRRRYPNRIVGSLDVSRRCVNEDERPHALGVHGGKQDGDWTDLVHSNKVGHGGLGGIEHPSYVFGEFLPCRYGFERYSIRSAGAPAVHVQDASGTVAIFSKEFRRLRNLPNEIDMTSEGVAEEEVAGAFAEDLVCDIAISDAHVPDTRRLHRIDSLPFGEGTVATGRESRDHRSKTAYGSIRRGDALCQLG